LAQAAGVATSTVRFYERRGLVKPDLRTGGNYRGYTSSSVERLKFIRAAQGSGFSLKDIAEMLQLTSSEEPPCREVAELIEHRLKEIRQRMSELKRVEKELATALKSCCKGGADWCGEIERLKGKKSSCAGASQKNSRGCLTLH